MTFYTVIAFVLMNLISFQNHVVLSIGCFYCSAADSSTCNQTQSDRICHPNKQKCMTLTYSKEYKSGVNKVKDTSYFLKKCVSTDVVCALFCRSIQVFGGKNCMVSCCSENLCNRSVKKEEIWFSMVRSSEATQLHVNVLSSALPAFVIIISLCGN